MMLKTTPPCLLVSTLRSSKRIFCATQLTNKSTDAPVNFCWQFENQQQPNNVFQSLSSDSSSSDGGHFGVNNEPGFGRSNTADSAGLQVKFEPFHGRIEANESTSIELKICSNQPGKFVRDVPCYLDIDAYSHIWLHIEVEFGVSRFFRRHYDHIPPEHS